MTVCRLVPIFQASVGPAPNPALPCGVPITIEVPGVVPALDCTLDHVKNRRLRGKAPLDYESDGMLRCKDEECIVVIPCDGLLEGEFLPGRRQVIASKTAPIRVLRATQ